VDLHTIHPNDGSHRRKKRLGRGHGSGRGKTGGRGTKGQNARNGGGWNPRFEGGQTPIHLRLPHRRGFKNPFRVPYEIIKLEDLEASAAFPEGTTVDRTRLETAGLIRRNGERPLKLLANGDIGKTLHFDGIQCSRTARARILAFGGSFQGIKEDVADVTDAPEADDIDAGDDTTSD